LRTLKISGDLFDQRLGVMKIRFAGQAFEGLAKIQHAAECGITQYGQCAAVAKP
jgi:hypothetical protein